MYKQVKQRSPSATHEKIFELRDYMRRQQSYDLVQKKMRRGGEVEEGGGGGPL